MKFAVCALIEKSGKILGVTRRNKVNDWGLPGGKIENGESAEEAIKREVFEETGLRVTSLEEIYCDVATEEGQEWSTICFLCQADGTAYPKEDGIDVAYISPKELCNKNNTFCEYNTKLLDHLFDKYVEIYDEDWDDDDFVKESALDFSYDLED